MKVVILAGGKGSRIKGQDTPKPLVKVGDKPILWHLLRYFVAFGYQEFILCLGYRGVRIQSELPEFFDPERFLFIDHTGGVAKEAYGKKVIVQMVDTGENTKTAGRLKRIRHLVGDADFIMTYADGLADIDLNRLEAFHRSHHKTATLTAIIPKTRFGILQLENNDEVTGLLEIEPGKNIWVNGGFFVLSSDVFKYLPENSEQIMWEDQPMQDLIKNRALCAYRHSGFWECMDTLNDADHLNELWQSQKAPWKRW